jgi:hypothetical protein
MNVLLVVQDKGLRLVLYQNKRISLNTRFVSRRHWRRRWANGGNKAPMGYVGNGCQPTSSPHQLGCCNVAPRRPHTVHRACRRNTSDEAFMPHLIAKGAMATGTRCPQLQTSQV